MAMLGLAITLSTIPAPYFSEQITRALCLGLLAASTDLTYGYGGVLPLGAALPFGIGMYVTAVALRGGVPFMVAAICACILVASIHGLLGFICLRRNIPGLYYSLSTLIATLCVQQLTIRSYQLLGGSNGIAGVPIPTLWLFQGQRWYFGIVMLVSLSIATCLLVLSRSRLGKAIEVTRDCGERMELLGYNTTTMKMILVGIGSIVAAIAGSLYVPLVGIADPTVFGVVPSMQVLVFVALGGQRSIFGPYLCAVVLECVRFQLGSEFENLYLFALGILYIGAVVVFPGGVVSLRSKLWA